MENLTENLKQFIELYDETQIPFKMKDLSTAFIEGEKSFLRDHAFDERRPSPPSQEQCRIWMRDALEGKIEGILNHQVESESGFARVTLKFEKTPENWNRDWLEEL